MLAWQINDVAFENYCITMQGTSLVQASASGKGFMQGGHLKVADRGTDLVQVVQ